jgi:predicted transcriptional regulator
MSSLLAPAKKRPTTTVTVLVDEELRGRLERAAAESERSLGAEVRVALKRHLERTAAPTSEGEE